MKYRRYFLLLGVANMLHGMSNDLVITKPYQLSFSMRHKGKIDNAKAGALALLSSCVAFAGQKYLGLPISPELRIALASGSFGAVILWQKYQEQKNPGQLVDLLLTNPQIVLNYLDSIAPEFQSKLERTTTDKLAQKYEQLKGFYEQKCPIFLLSECQADFCPLSRNNTLSCRKAFEIRMTDVLLEKLNSRTNQNPTEYVSFASGELFQDLVILTRVLAKNPNATMNIHFIDLQFIVHHIINDFMQKSPELSTDSENSLPDKTEELIGRFHEHFPGSETDSDDNVYNKVCGAYTILQGRGLQLAQWTKTTFPNSSLHFYLHADKDRYLNYARENRMNPDVLVAIDMEETSAFNAYRSLHKDALAMNKNLTSIVCEDYCTLR